MCFSLPVESSDDRSKPVREAKSEEKGKRKHIRNEARSRQFLQRMVADHQRVGKPKDYSSQLPHSDGHAKTHQMRILCSVLSKRIHHPPL